MDSEVSKLIARWRTKAAAYEQEALTVAGDVIRAASYGKATSLLRAAEELEAALAATLSAGEAWRPIAEAPTGKLCVVGWHVHEAGWPTDRHDFDYIEDGRWVNHDENVDHAESCAPAGSGMPPREPPYQHFIELPALTAPLAAAHPIG